MKRLLSISLALLAGTPVVFCQKAPIKVSSELTITPLSDHVYIHTCDYSNGIIYHIENEVIIVSTPPTDEATECLINWVDTSLRSTVIAYVIDRWHPDAMEGLDVVRSKNIPTYSSKRTYDIAIQKYQPVAKTTFEEKLELDLKGHPVIVHFLGEAHSTDGVVAWLPDERTLFGGNEVRNYEGWVGNIGDANLNEWANTIRQVKKHYGNAEVVIPGHGPHGGPELLDYTIELFTLPQDHAPFLVPMSSFTPQLFEHGDLKIAAQSQEKEGDIFHYQNPQLQYDHLGRTIHIWATELTYDPTKEVVSVPEGRIEYTFLEQTHTLNFQELYLGFRDDHVGLTLVIKSFIK